VRVTAASLEAESLIGNGMPTVTQLPSQLGSGRNSALTKRLANVAKTSAGFMEAGN
jgi:hypothetical protein